jgi:PIN domain nuclease of toxin-antitoxin system
MGAVVLDSSVVIALFDPEDAHHETAAATARQLRAEGATMIAPATVLAEVLVGSARQGTAAVAQRRAVMAAAFGRPRPIDEDIAVAAAHLRARQPALRLPDALVIATGIVDDAAVLTADKRWANIDPRIQLIG